jgi:hypothetical protein
MNTESFFEPWPVPRRKISTDTAQNDTPSKPMSAEDFAKFFGKTLLSELGQGPIKKNPKRSKEWLRKQEEKNNEPISEEMKAQMIELF